MAEEVKAEKKAAAPKTDKKAGAKTRQPSALKRDLQSEKRRQRNRSYRASVLTSVRALEQALSQKEPMDKIKERLNAIYSLMDKGVKRGVYKPQKASRTKSRLAARVAK